MTAGVLPPGNSGPLAAPVRIGVRLGDFTGYPKVPTWVLMQRVAMCDPTITAANFGNVHNTTDIVALLLAGRCWRTLTSVNFSDCPDLTDTAVETVARLCTLLNDVNFNNCNALTGKALVRALAANCHTLQKAHLGIADDRDTLDDDDVILLATQCRGLKELGLPQIMGNVGTPGWQGLADRCTRLTRLNFGDAHSLTDQVFTTLVRNCPELVDITMENCVLLTDAAVKVLAENRPNLRTIILVPWFSDYSLGGETATHHSEDEWLKLTHFSVEALADNCREIKNAHIMVLDEMKTPYSKKKDGVFDYDAMNGLTFAQAVANVISQHSNTTYLMGSPPTKKTRKADGAQPPGPEGGGGKAGVGFTHFFN